MPGGQLPQVIVGCVAVLPLQQHTRWRKGVINGQHDARTSMPRPPKKSSIDIALIGAGTLGTALATQLHKRGYRITEIVSRDDAGSLRRARNLAKHVGAEAEAISKAEFGAKLVWICVPDDAVSTVA